MICLAELWYRRTAGVSGFAGLNASVGGPEPDGLVEGGLAGLGLPGPRLEQQQAANLLLDNQDC